MCTAYEGGSIWEYKTKQGNPTSPREGILLRATAGAFTVVGSQEICETNKEPEPLEDLSIVCEDFYPQLYVRTEAHVDETSVHMGQAQEVGQVNVHDDIWIYNFSKQEVYTITSHLMDSNGTEIATQSWEVHTDKDAYELPDGVTQKDINMGANGEGQFYTWTYSVNNPEQYAGSYLYFKTTVTNSSGEEVWNSDEKEADQSKNDEKVTFSLVSTEEKDEKTGDHITYADPGTVEDDTETGGTGKKRGKRKSGQRAEEKRR